MQIFGIDLWRIILCIALIIIVVNRSNLVAMYAKKLYIDKKYEKAIKTFKVADNIGNMNISNKSMYGYALLRGGDVDKAYTVLRGILPYTKSGSAARYQLKNLLALTLWKQDKLDEAIEEMEEIIEANYKTTVIYQNLGIFYNLSGNAQKAIRFNEEAYEYNSDDYIILDNLAESYARSGNYEKASELYGELLSRDPEPHFPEPYYTYGEVLINAGQREKGIELIEKALTKTFTFLSLKTKEEVEEILKKYK